MSGYTKRIREELFEKLPAAACCKRSMLAGMLINAEPGRDGALYIRISGEREAELAGDLVSGLYGRRLEAEKKNCYGKTAYDAIAYSEPLSALIKSMTDPAHISEPPAFFGCKHCKSFFCAGLMMTAVTVSDPSQSSRAEIKLGDPALTPKLSEFFMNEGLDPHVTSRKGTGGLLFKKSEDIESLVGLCGAKNSMMEIMQQKLVREFRGDINRQSNCEVANIAKSTGAAAGDIAAVTVLKASGQLYKLSEELRETAELRLNYPEASLAELASLHEPPISKSGLNHRLQKLKALAGENGN